MTHALNCRPRANGWQMSEELPEANILDRIGPWLTRRASALGCLKPAAKAAGANKRRTGLGVLAAVFVVGALRQRIRSQRAAARPARRVSGSAITTWAEVYGRLEQSAPASSMEYAKAQASALEALFGGEPDFGYLFWAENRVDIVVVKGDWFHDLDVMDHGDVMSTSALVSRLSRIETRDARDGMLRLDIAHESRGWFWDAQNPEAREALLSFAAQLRRRSSEVR